MGRHHLVLQLVHGVHNAYATHVKGPVDVHIRRHHLAGGEQSLHHRVPGDGRSRDGQGSVRSERARRRNPLGAIAHLQSALGEVYDQATHIGRESHGRRHLLHPR